MTMPLTGLPPVSAPLPWQSELWSRLNQQLQSTQLPHAILLNGAEHTGKGLLGLALARLLLCEEPSGGLNCGQCHACNLSASGANGDFRWLQPEEKSRNIKIDQVRQLVSFATKTAGFGLRKVMVLAPADSMNVNAANALLKLLEEPAQNTYLILVCHRLHGVPATVRSRCQIVKAPEPASAESLEWLDRLTGQREESSRLLELSGGAPLLAEAIYKRADGEELIKARLAIVGLLAGTVAPNQAVNSLASAPPEEVLTQLTSALQELARGYSHERLTSCAGRAIFELLDDVGQIARSVRGGANPNKQLIAEALVGKVQRVLGAAAAGGNIKP